MINNNPVVLTIDLGTQSVKALLVDKNGGILHKTQHKYENPYYSKYPGWAEQKPEVYWNCLCEITNRMKAEAQELWDNIIAMTITTIRDTCICLDKDGKPLRDFIVWLDKRQVQMSNPFHFIPKTLFSLAGMSDTANLQRRISACNWIMENESGIWDRTHKFIFVSGYLTYKLTGRLVDSTANMVGHIPFNGKTRKWMGKFELNRAIFDVELEKLTELMEPGGTLGYISETAASETGLPRGLPLIATGSDKGCETLGLSCLKPDRAALSFGTTATIQFTTDKYVEPLPYIPAFPAVIKGKYNPEIMVYRGYWLITWFKKEFAHKEVERAAELKVSPEAILEKMIHKIPPGCDGLFFQPYFTPGVTMPRSRGAFTGFSDIHTRAHMYKAIIEGINFALMEGLNIMEKRAKIKVERLFLSSGGSQSDRICQITSNMFGLPVNRIQTYEAGALGSSMVAFASMGVHADLYEAAKKMVRIKDEFKPDLKESETYKFLSEKVFNKIFNKMLPLYKVYEDYINAKKV